ncbi:unnamed protein product [Coregonus sp. 'balchen']|nr:unnamed protein product [Coregonus sp. 'balchen']
MDREVKKLKEEIEREREKGVAAMVACYQGFDPAAYLQYNYMPPRADFDRQDSIVLSACEVFDTVFLTDFLEVNRQELRRWLQGEGKGYSSLDWTPYLQHKAARLRSVVSDILPIDVHLPRPLPLDSQLPTAGADCLVSCFCLESVSPDLASFTRALGHIRGLLRPGGHLLLIGALGESYYMGGPGVRIPVVPLDEAQVCASVRASGYTLVRLEVYTLPQGMKVGVDDVTGVFFVKARKP